MIAVGATHGKGTGKENQPRKGLTRLSVNPAVAYHIVFSTRDRAPVLHPVQRMPWLP